MINNASRITEEYNNAIINLHQKIVKKLFIISGILVAVTLVFLYLANNGNVFEVLFFIFMGISLLLLIISILVKIIPYTSQKLFYNTIFPELIKDINYNEDISIDCKVLTKDKDTNIRGGLFTRYATVDNKFQLEFLNKEGYQVIMSDTKIITSSDKSTTIHFDGTYFVFKIENRNLFQLRSNSSPKLAKVKFNKISTRDDIKEYVREDDAEHIQTRFYTLFDFLKKKYPNKNCYISGVEKEIHVAIWRDEKNMRFSKLSVNDLDLIRKHIMDKIMLSEEIFNIIYV